MRRRLMKEKGRRKNEDQADHIKKKENAKLVGEGVQEMKWEK